MCKTIHFNLIHFNRILDWKQQEQLSPSSLPLPLSLSLCLSLSVSLCLSLSLSLSRAWQRGVGGAGAGLGVSQPVTLTLIEFPHCAVDVNGARHTQRETERERWGRERETEHPGDLAAHLSTAN